MSVSELLNRIRDYHGRKKALAQVRFMEHVFDFICGHLHGRVPPEC